MEVLKLLIVLNSAGLIFCSRFHKRDIDILHKADIGKHAKMEKYLDFFFYAAQMAGFTAANRGLICNDGWLTFQGSCYLFVDDPAEKRTMEQAEEYCVRQTAHIVSVESFSEDAFLKKHLMSLYRNPKDRENFGVLIGATDAEKEQTFRWKADNSPLTYRGFRGNDYVSEDEDCVVMWGPYNFEWGDIGCNYESQFICKKSK